jgi:hypothetical protein
MAPPCRIPAAVQRSGAQAMRAIIPDADAETNSIPKVPTKGIRD